ncbi:MAG TPA: tripartite tricarboxylate transporter TctB family protein [Pseudolabrys sp.]|jgi:putative tricarboxylic transport membrane protein|nr:tripartite tricarboxylate transporter TctB family protein [Pseudolabrys sp.]
MAGWGRLAVRVRNPQNFYGGLALVGLAAIALIATAELAGIEDARFGAGTAPRIFAGLLALVGAGIALAGLLIDGPRIERFAFRGPAFVIAAILAFAMLVRPLGLLIATYVTFMVAIMGSNEMRWIESLIAAAAMTAFCIGLFVYLLKLPFQLFPAF